LTLLLALLVVLLSLAGLRAMRLCSLRSAGKRLLASYLNDYLTQMYQMRPGYSIDALS
jgi:hypothetical protein